MALEPRERAGKRRRGRYDRLLREGEVRIIDPARCPEAQDYLKAAREAPPDPDPVPTKGLWKDGSGRWPLERIVV